MEPTKEQAKEFWEHWGFKRTRLSGGHLGWLYPPEYSLELEYLPRVDLNNLIKYAVPKLTEQGFEVCIYFMPGDNGEALVIIKDWNNAIPEPSPSAVSSPSRKFTVPIQRVELALFWAICKVIKC